MDIIMGIIAIHLVFNKVVVAVVSHSFLFYSSY